jgi:hypothetical protein
VSTVKRRPRSRRKAVELGLRDVDVLAERLLAEPHVERHETPVGMTRLRIGKVGRRIEDDGRVLSR